MLLTDGALLATALFTGAAVYVTFVEHPARMSCAPVTAVAQWRPSYRRATIMQASLALLGTMMAVAAWLSGAGIVWLVASALIGAVVPFTLVVMWPTNKSLENVRLDTSAEQARGLLQRWGHLHAVRSGLSVTALLLMILARG